MGKMILLIRSKEYEHDNFDNIIKYCYDKLFAFKDNLGFSLGLKYALEIVGKCYYSNNIIHIHINHEKQIYWCGLVFCVISVIFVRYFIRVSYV